MKDIEGTFVLWTSVKEKTFEVKLSAQIKDEKNSLVLVVLESGTLLFIDYCFNHQATGNPLHHAALNLELKITFRSGTNGLFCIYVPGPV